MTTNTNAYLAIDIGTHAVRACLFLPPHNHPQDDWVMTHVHSQDIQLNHLAPRYIEQNPLEIIESVQKVCTLALKELSPNLGLIPHISLGFAIQRSSVLAWDRETGKAVSEVLSWQDTRGFKRMSQLTPAQITTISDKTGLVPSAHHGASKIQWLQEDLAIKDPQFTNDIIYGPLAAWIINQLTGHNFCDPVNAARTLLFNYENSDWDNDLAQIFNLDSIHLPAIQPSRSIFGAIRPHVIQSNDNNYMQTFELNTAMGDQNAAYVAMRNSQFFQGVNFKQPLIMNIGSGAFVLGQSDKDAKASDFGLLKSLAFSSDDCEQWLIEGTVNGAGTALSYWLSHYQPQLSEQELFNQLPQWLDNSENEILFFYTLGGIGSPFWLNNFSARDSDFFTLDGKPCSPSLQEQAVAVINSIAYLLVNNIMQLRQVSETTIYDGIITTGGLARCDGLLERIAVLCGLPIFIAQCHEATLQGVAMLSSEFQYKPRLLGRILADKKTSPVLRNRYERYIELLKTQAL